jgi:lysophospholipase L1-like esterase
MKLRVSTLVSNLILICLFLIMTACQQTRLDSSNFGSSLGSALAVPTSPGSTPVPTAAPTPLPTPVATATPIPPQTISNYDAFGDSITHGVGASTPALDYVSLIGTDEHANVTNRGISGALACDVTDLEIFPFETPTASTSTVYTMLIGTNDSNTKGTGAYEAVYNSCVAAALTWIGVPSTSKVTAQSSGCVKTGNWLKNSSLPLAGLYSQTNGDQMNCSITTQGGPLYIWYRVTDQNGGQFSISVDGGAPQNFSNSFSTSIATQNGGHSGEALARVTGLATGTHSVFMVVKSATSSSNPVFIFGVGTPSNGSAANTPHFYVGGIPRQDNDTKSAITAQYNTDIQNDIIAADQDGLYVIFVNIRAYLMGNASDMNDYLHPNNLGHSELRNAFEASEKLFYKIN